MAPPKTAPMKTLTSSSSTKTAARGRGREKSENVNAKSSTAGVKQSTSTPKTTQVKQSGLGKLEVSSAKTLQQSVSEKKPVLKASNSPDVLSPIITFRASDFASTSPSTSTATSTSTSKKSVSFADLPVLPKKSSQSGSRSRISGSGRAKIKAKPKTVTTAPKKYSTVPRHIVPKAKPPPKHSSASQKTQATKKVSLSSATATEPECRLLRPKSASGPATTVTTTVTAKKKLHAKKKGASVSNNGSAASTSASTSTSTKSTPKVRDSKASKAAKHVASTLTKLKALDVAIGKTQMADAARASKKAAAAAGTTQSKVRQFPPQCPDLPLCTAYPGTKEWDEYWHLFETAMKKYNTEMAEFQDGMKEFSEDLDNYRRAAKRIQTNDRVDTTSTRASVGPSTAFGSKSVPDFGIGTANGSDSEALDHLTVFNGYVLEARNMNAIVSNQLGRQDGIRIELNVKGIDPGLIQIAREHNMLTISIMNSKVPKFLRIGMPEGKKADDLEIYPPIYSQSIMIIDGR